MNNKIEQISNLFGSKTRYKILKLYAERGESRFFVREITRTIDEQINSVRRELENLESIGLLDSKLKNNKRYFFVNPKSKIYPGLCSIFGQEHRTKHSDRPQKTGQKQASIMSDSQVAKLKQLCTNLLVNKPGSSSKMPVDIFCVVADGASKIKALSILRSVEEESGLDIQYSVSTQDEYDLGIKLNADLYGTIYKNGHRLI